MPDRLMLILATSVIVVGCSGPQPLSTAIRTADQRAYKSASDRHPESPKLAFYHMKAAETGSSVEETARRDAALLATKNPFDANKEPIAVSRGAVIYQTHCMRCHGPEVRGNGPDLLPSHPCKDFHAFDKRFAVTLHKGAPRAWFKKISEGHGDIVKYPDGKGPAMPAFGDKLAREQIWLVITYLQSLDAHADAARE